MPKLIFQNNITTIIATYQKLLIEGYIQNNDIRNKQRFFEYLGSVGGV